MIMKDYLNKTKELFKKVNKKVYSYESRGISPGRDWMILLITSLFIVIASAVSATYLYFQIDAGEIFVVRSDDKQNEIKTNQYNYLS